MADIKKTIEILFEGTNNVGSTITSVGRSIDELNYRVGKVAQPFADLSGAVLKLDAALVGLAVGGLVLSFNESSKLQSAFTELKKVAGDNVEVLDGAKNAAKELSNEYGEASADILASTANYVQAGFDVEQAMKLTKTGMDLVIAGGVDAAVASEILIAALKGFKAPAEDAGRLLDILNDVSNKYATDIEQLGTGMAALSPIAKTMGFSMEETAGILTPVIEVFRSGDEAAVALKTGLLKLIDDSEPVKNALASIGVSQRDANGELRSGKDILNDVSVAFTTLDQNQKLFVTQQLVGINQSARMVEVFDGLAKSTAITAVAMASAGSAAAEVAIRLKDPEVAVKRLVESFKNMSSAIGDEFQDAGVATLDGVTNIFSALERAVAGGAFAPILDALNDFLNDIGSTFDDIANALPEAFENVDFSNIVEAFDEIRETIGGLFGDFDLSKPEDISKAVQGVVNSLESLIRFTTGISEVFVSLAGTVGDLVDWFNTLDKETVATVANLAGIGAAVAAISVPIGAIASAITGIGALAAAPIIGPIVAVGATIGATVGAAELLTGALYKLFNPETDGALSEEMKQTEADIKAIYAAAGGAEAATESYGDTAKKSFLEIVNSTEAAGESTKSLRDQMAELGILVEEPKTVSIETADAVDKLQELEYYRESTGTWETIKVPVDTSEIEKAKSAIEEIPAVKRLELETELNIEEVKANAEIIQSSMEFKAQVDIAEIEAATERIVTMSNNITEMFADTGKTITGLFSEWGDDTSLQEKWAIQDSLSAEQERRDKTLKMQEDLNTAQIKYMDEKTASLRRGDAMITINGDGLQPHLEMIMWEVFAAIQVRATQEGLDQLLLGGAP